MNWKETKSEKPMFNERVFVLSNGEILIAYLDKVELNKSGETQKWYSNKDSIYTPSHWSIIQSNDLPEGYRINKGK